MNKKQIEEMAEYLYGMSIDTEADCQYVAEALYNAGYRKQREGEWIKDAPHWNYHCNQCGYYPFGMIANFYSFCPNCGAKMKGE